MDPAWLTRWCSGYHTRLVMGRRRFESCSGHVHVVFFFIPETCLLVPLSLSTVFISTSVVPTTSPTPATVPLINWMRIQTILVTTGRVLWIHTALS